MHVQFNVLFWEVFCCATNCGYFSAKKADVLTALLMVGSSLTSPANQKARVDMVNRLISRGSF